MARSVAARTVGARMGVAAVVVDGIVARDGVGRDGVGRRPGTGPGYDGDRPGLTCEPAGRRGAVVGDQPGGGRAGGSRVRGDDTAGSAPDWAAVGRCSPGAHLAHLAHLCLSLRGGHPVGSHEQCRRGRRRRLITSDIAASPGG